ncbi:MAG: substrate-binding domain-containing protein [Anaerolineae bacterium]
MRKAKSEKRNSWLWLVGLFVGLVVLAGCGGAEPENKDIILATTTSTQDSGLLDELIPIFEEQSSYHVKIIAVGTGKALKMGQEGNADVLLVHAPDAEQVLVDEGTAVDRRLVMHNDFVIVGPANDPAGVRGMSDPAAALTQIATSQAVFVTRGDDSGTNKKEMALWAETAVTPTGDWYLESGQGMGATLRIASEKAGYTLTDRATYLALRDTLDLEIVVEGDASLKNVYHIMRVNPQKWPLVNEAGGKTLADFFTAADTQTIIAEFGVDKFGQPLFFPDAVQEG